MKRFITACLVYLVLLPFVYTSAAATTVKDLRILPQDHTHYLTPGLFSVSKSMQDPRELRYMTLYFSPWLSDRTPPSLDNLTGHFLRFMENPGYGENKKKRTSAWMEKLWQNADMENYPNADMTAISLTTANLRFVPTDKPRYNTPDGYPFDRFQISSIAPNTPLRILHVTADKAWFLVRAPQVYGWIASRDMAVVNPTFIHTWRTGKYAAMIRDKIPLYDQYGNFLFEAPIGAIFPIVEERDATFRVLVAVADSNKRGVSISVSLSKEVASVRPLHLTEQNMLKITNDLINEPYGWGGLYQNRDCSAMLKDIFAPFGIWLPRHSADQVKEAGYFIDLADMPRQEKEKIILEQGVPYLTLLWMKGHIMLYMGVHDGKPLIFHNVWGMTGKKRWNKPLRVYIGHAAITTLSPVTENGFQDDLIDKIMGMALIFHPENAEFVSSPETD